MSSPSWLESLAKSWGKGWEEQEAIWRWPEAVGEGLSKLARPLYVEGGILHVAVPSPVVANELRLWAQEIVARLAQVAPKSNVKELRFRVVPEKSEDDFPIRPTANDLRRAEEIIPDSVPKALRPKLVELLASVLAQEEAILARGGRKCRRCGAAFMGEEDECPICRLLP